VVKVLQRRKNKLRLELSGDQTKTTIDNWVILSLV
jgi:hypothetical protein